MKARNRILLAVETLESRLSPAVTVINATTATFTDVDGDAVTVKVSAGTLTEGLFTTVAAGLGEQLQMIDLSAGGFDGVSLTVTAVKGPTGDGLVNVGYVNSTGHDLGKVTIKGDLGQIDAGDSDPALPAVKLLNVRSMGRLGTDTQSVSSSVLSNINGALGSLIVRGDVVGAVVNVDDGPDGTIGRVHLGGSLIGGGFESNGAVAASGDMGPVKVGGNVIGSTETFSGAIASLGGSIASVKIAGSLIGGVGPISGVILSAGVLGPIRIGGNLLGGAGESSGQVSSGDDFSRVTIGGSVIGGLGEDSGRIVSSDNMGPVKIGGDLTGGSGLTSGRISASKNLTGVIVAGSVKGGSGTLSGAISCDSILGSVSIGQSLTGGAGNLSGQIRSKGDTGTIRIGRDFIGGSIGPGSANLNESGYIESLKRIDRIIIGGSIISGIDDSTVGNLTKNASIRAGHDIGAIVVEGGLVGNTNANGDSPVIISARGREFPVAGSDLAIASIAVGGNVERAQILAGYDVNLVPKNADAQVGTVLVGGDWVASSLAAGVVPGSNGFGNSLDAKITGAGTTDSSSTTSSIGRIVIKGEAFGTTESISGSDHFGFVAQRIGFLKIGGRTIGLNPGAANDLAALAIGPNGDLAVREVLL